ncbi:hypothetical protein A3D81_00780 [Candidatus Curtissbacteria bacterium RIFCSPHIGHO2_02_FULL_40_17]|uniref:Endonuclease NucS C-terminal domain-containing protein n=4 Tax=Patescibacteria group TaxID=1783273 RepID=A0A1G2HI45_9BACT|nr:MAG: hypothetical protein A3D81_00780 [Candidatus Curtissbacteria bacterium RIFCSPHIGHO2_02_FULL_40_17]OGE03849.1 MAG: hypothetical protein A3F45_01095 [Candidatus Curtissbacteria bacterium RIFCSPHIGHO2_12_FULL_41_17]OGE05925.1 MAG: hypothetical protein A3I53_02270 [Candidatus Curtissbacteria bacterium RIFCSPLOWO2_02_FULL_40_13b]OGZ61558.1 MAG: hypothetical protein A3F94_00250 [Candidatus Spechtbacteria bacterium RIFCSPLOWO2_12_FULL_38_22]
MEKQELKQLFNNFLAIYDVESKDAIWVKQSQLFRDFWDNKILADGNSELNDAEVDQIIRILDRNGRGNTRESEAVARAMVAQGAWRRMFNGIKARKEFSSLLNKIFLEEDTTQKAGYINELYKLNEEKHINNLTGPSGNALGAMLAAFYPVNNLSIISLNDREKLCSFLGIQTVDFSSEDIGNKIAASNSDIIKFFENAGIHYSARTVSVFAYSAEFKSFWKVSKIEAEEEVQASFPTVSQEISDPSLFYMESQLEDFIIENWDKTEFGNKYDLIEENGELVSQQYRTDIGIIDILAKDKKTDQYVVIELKKNQTSDDTVGQLTRYMGWLEEKKTSGKPTKGIIIAGHYDERLYFALKKLKDVEVYLYQVDFKLNEFKK